jgi:hypothetical protein
MLRIRETIIWRLQEFKATRWTMLICANMFDSMHDDDKAHKGKLATFRRWINLFEQEVNSTPVQNLTPGEAQSRLGGTLEVRSVTNTQ